MRTAVDEVGVVLDYARTPEDALDRMLGALDRYTGHDPISVLFTETYLAAARDAELRTVLGDLVADFRGRFARTLGAHGVDRPEETAAVLTAAIDGIMLHRAVSPGLTAEAVGPVLRRLLTPGATGRLPERKAGEDG